MTGNGGLGMGWKLTAGSLPPGLAINANGSPGDTTISGTPTTPGIYTFTVKVGDTDGFVPDRSTSKQFTIAVVTPLTVAASPNATPTGVVGKIYRATVAAVERRPRPVHMGRSRRAASRPGSPSTLRPARSPAARRAPGSSRSPSL